MVDHYETLGISADASQEEIKQAFREKAKEKHPDHNNDPRASKQFARIKEAYDVLSDPDARAQYDATGCSVDGEYEQSSSKSTQQRKSTDQSTASGSTASGDSASTSTGRSASDSTASGTANQSTAYAHNLNRSGFENIINGIHNSSNPDQSENINTPKKAILYSVSVFVPFLISLFGAIQTVAVGGRMVDFIPEVIVSLLPPVLLPVPLALIPVFIVGGFFGTVVGVEELYHPEHPIKELVYEKIYYR